VTTARLVFFARHGRSGHDKLIEISLADVRQTRLRGWLRHRRIELSGPTFDHVVRECWRGDAQRLADRLAG
jgi:hypothetical protein